jgi:DNA-binding NtrC family response regulator
LQQSLGFEDAHCVPYGLVGDSPELHRVLRKIKELTNSRFTVLIAGESGTGKELVASALHSVSPGLKRVFVAVDSASLPATLLEDQLFGHAQGSFTGASTARRGLMEQANGGTLFFDEIGELPLDVQPKLLRALQQREVRPLGSERTVKVDVRIIAATNRDLAAEVRKGRFRADLFYRLNVVNLRLAPLRSHPGDIPALIEHFLRVYGANPGTITPYILKILVARQWPGNVRELENCIMRIIASGVEDFQDELGLELPDEPGGADQAKIKFPSRPIPMAHVEFQAIMHALRFTSDDQSKAAQLLGLGRTTLYRRMKEFRRAGYSQSATA